MVVTCVSGVRPSKRLRGRMDTSEPESAHSGISKLPARTAVSYESWFEDTVALLADVRAAMRSRMARSSSSLCAFDDNGDSDTQ